MKTQSLLRLAAPAVLLLLVGCAGSSRSTSTNNNSTGGASSADRAGWNKTSLPESWEYNALPTPAPSKSPDHRLNEIAFKDNSTRLDDEGLAVCRTTAAEISTMGTPRILVVGFAHETENDPDLALRRAEAVRSGLVAQGLPTSIIEVASFGTRFSGTTNSPHPYMLTASQGVEIWTLHD